MVVPVKVNKPPLMLTLPETLTTTVAAFDTPPLLNPNLPPLIVRFPPIFVVPPDAPEYNLKSFTGEPVFVMVRLF